MGTQGVGAELRAVREHLGWALEDVAASLRIRHSYLQAIEDGRVKDLPGTTYAMGFVRTYASSLGLDPDETVRRFKAEAGPANLQQELHFPAPVPDRGVPAGAVVLLGAVIAVAGYIGWYKLSENHATPEAVQEVPEHLAPLARKDEPKPAPAPASSSVSSSSSGSPSSGLSLVAPQAASGSAGGDADGRMAAGGEASGQTAGQAAAPPAAAVPGPFAAPESTGRQIASGNGGTQAGGAAAGSAMMAGQLSSVASPGSAPGQPEANRPGAAPAAGAPAASASGGGTDAAQRGLLLKANADAWIQVRAQHGPILLNKLLHAGESWAVPEAQAGQGPLLLTTGNAGGTEIVLDGHTLPPLGGSGAVRRNVPLEASALQTAASAAPAQPAPAPRPAPKPVKARPANTVPGAASGVASPAPQPADEGNSPD